MFQNIYTIFFPYSLQLSIHYASYTLSIDKFISDYLKQYTFNVGTCNIFLSNIVYFLLTSVSVINYSYFIFCCWICDGYYFDPELNPIEFYDIRKCSNLACDNISSTALRYCANFYICYLNFLIGKNGLRLYLFFYFLYFYLLASSLYFVGSLVDFYYFLYVLSLYVTYSRIFCCCTFLGMITVVFDCKNAYGSLFAVFFAIFGCLQ